MGVKIPSSLRWKSTGVNLGRGGQGWVMLVADSKGEHEGYFALKALDRNHSSVAYERFAKEIRAIQCVSHPGIIKVVDSSSDGDEFHFYTMEYFKDAISLKKLVRPDSNPYYGNPLNCLALCEQLVAAIGCCAEKRIIHRDLSPANILVLPKEKIKIIDFGLCQTAEGIPITLSNEGVGTPTYMAPECESGGSGGIVFCSDIYSVGKIVWSAICGQPAFSREAPAFNRMSMKSRFPMMPSCWHFHHIFEKTIRHRPSDRWSDLGDAEATLAHVRYLIESGFPPLERLLDACPHCGVGDLQGFEQSHSVFGNPNPPGIHSVQCNYCGFCFARNRGIAANHLQDREKLR